MKIVSTKEEYQVDDVGIFTPKRTPRDFLTAGEVGYVIAGIKDIDGAPVGDTITTADAILNRYRGLSLFSRVFLPVCSQSVPKISKICVRPCENCA